MFSEFLRSREIRTTLVIYMFVASLECFGKCCGSSSVLVFTFDFQFSIRFKMFGPRF